MADISLSREQASFIILKSCVWSVIDCPVGRIMRGFLILSFHLVLFCSAQGEGQLEDIRTKVEKILIEKEDKSWADMIMFETIFLEIIQNSLQLPLEVAGQETKSESFPHHQQGRIDFNTVNPSLCAGKDLLIHSL